MKGSVVDKELVPITLLVAQDAPQQVLGEPCDSASENDTKNPYTDDSDTI
jgi:hypothetical protein